MYYSLRTQDVAGESRLQIEDPQSARVGVGEEGSAPVRGYAHIVQVGVVRGSFQVEAIRAHNFVCFHINVVQAGSASGDVCQVGGT